MHVTLRHPAWSWPAHSPRNCSDNAHLLMSWLLVFCHVLYCPALCCAMKGYRVPCWATKWLLWGCAQLSLTSRPMSIATLLSTAGCQSQTKGGRCLSLHLQEPLHFVEWNGIDW